MLGLKACGSCLSNEGGHVGVSKLASSCDLRPLPSYGAVAKRRRVNGRGPLSLAFKPPGIPLLLALLTPWAIFVASYALAAFSVHHAAPVSTR